MVKIAIASLTGLLLLSFAAVADTLIKESESKLPPAAASITTRSITRGPGIRLVSPDAANQKLTSPFLLQIAFEPHGGAKIDLSSIKLTYLKTPSVELLDRVRSGLSEKGIEMASAEVPPGEHQIRVTVQDSEGRQTNTVINLSVVK